MENSLRLLRVQHSKPAILTRSKSDLLAIDEEIMAEVLPMMNVPVKAW